MDRRGGYAEAVMTARPSALSAALLLTLACAAPHPASPPPAPHGPPEVHLADLRQLTFGGENAEAYWSFDGTQLSMQAHTAERGCDRIFRMVVQPPFVPIPVSSGEGATTCSF